MAKIKDVDILRSLQLLMSSGISISSALLEIAERIKDPKKAEKLITMSELISNEGMSFSDALEYVEFCSNYVHIIRIGEKTGQLIDVLRDVINYMDEMERIKKKVISSVIYPAIVVVFSIFVGFGLTFVVQKILNSLSMHGSEKMFAFQLGWFIVNNRIWIFLGYITFLILLVVLVVKNINKIPIVKGIYNQISIGKAFSLIGLALRSRESIIQSFVYASNVVHGKWKEYFESMAYDLETKNVIDVIDEIENHISHDDFLVLRSKIKSGDTWGGFSTVGERQIQSAMRKIEAMTPLVNVVTIFFASAQIIVLLLPIALIIFTYTEYLIK